MTRLWGIGAIGAICWLLAAGPARADDDDGPAIALTSLQLNGLYLAQSVGNSMTGQFSWAPLVDFGPVGLRGEVGLFIPRNAFGDRFLAFNYEAFVRVPVGADLTFEGGGGLETYTGTNGGTHPVAGVGIAFELDDTGSLDRVFASYQRFFLHPDLSEIRIGIGIVF